jgi:ubiquinone/menaquinone biosynthesis C-methylase UbiE
MIKNLDTDMNSEYMNTAKRKLKVSGINNIEFAVGRACDTGFKESAA